MNWLKRKRIRQVIKFGWNDAKVIALCTNKGRIAVWLDMIWCFKKYYLFSNQYKSKEVWKIQGEEREKLVKELGERNRYRDEWTVSKYENAAFINKYSSVKYGSDPKRYNKRLKQYAKRYNLGVGTTVSNNVTIERNHYLEGSIQVGKNVLLSKNVFIDYSGEVVIKDNVQLTNGVIIESHHHLFHSDPSASRDIVMPTKLVIEDGAVIGSRAIILSSCHYIGKNARIGAGAVVTKDVPDNSVVVGVPAKVVKYFG